MINSTSSSSHPNAPFVNPAADVTAASSSPLKRKAESSLDPSEDQPASKKTCLHGRAQKIFEEAIGLSDQPSMASKTVGSLQTAADLGHAEAQYQLACLYDKGDKGVLKNKQKALGLFEKAALQNHKDARLEVFRFYEEEEEVLPQSEERTITILKAGVEEGDKIAQFWLGKMHLHGHCPEVLPKDKKYGKELLEKAASQNHAGAMCLLGYLYEEGDAELEIPISIPKAHEYFERAWHLGHPDAIEWIDCFHI